MSNPAQSPRRGRRNFLRASTGGLTLALAGGKARANAPVELTMYYPIAVGGPITGLVDRMVADFHAANPGIQVKPIYAGTYAQTLLKSLTAAKGGQPPSVSVLLPNDFYTMLDADVIEPIDDLVSTDADRAWLRGFYPAYLMNNGVGGKVYGIPFQRSTPVMYWNKAAFKDAGLDPDKPPQTWNELVEMGRKLVRRDGSGNVNQWGVGIPSTSFPEWLFQCFTTTNGTVIMNDAGNRTFFTDPKVVEALQFWVDLGRKHQVMAPGIIEWGTTPRDFFERRIAIMWTTSGNLTNVRKNAQFPFGVAMIPGKAQRGTPTGGGNFYLFKGQSAAQKAAALTFMKWMTSPERAAEWSIATGYVAVTPAAWETPAMKRYAAEFPEVAVARDQLQHATATLSTHENERVTKILGDSIQAALTNQKSAAQAMQEAQAQAERILRRYR